MKNKKFLFIILFSGFLFFGINESVAAFDANTINCGDAPNNTKFGVFSIDNGSGSDLKCVLVMAGQEYVTFDGLDLPDEWENSDVRREVKNCHLNSWDDRDMINPKAKTAQYLLQKTINVDCGTDFLDKDIRYVIEKEDDGEAIIKFVGFYKEITKFNDGGSGISLQSTESSYGVKLGETKDITLNVATLPSGYQTSDIKCTNCDGMAIKIKQKNTNQIVITLDTNVMLEKGLLPLEKDNAGNSVGTINFEVMASTDYLDWGRTMTFSLPYTVLSFDCSKAKNDDECTDPTIGNPKMCFWWPAENKCESRIETKNCSRLPENLCGPNNANGSEKCVWNKEQNQCLNPVDSQIVNEYEVPGGYTGALPPCAFSGTCRNINDILQLVVNFANGMFMIMGAFSFVFFIYGGFTMVISFGSAEKVKKSKDMMMAAVIGLVVAICAGLLVDTLLDVVGVSSTYCAFDL